MPKIDTAITGNVEVRLLTDSAFGPCNAVATIPAAELAEAKANGLVDDDPDAVAYAKSLAQPAA